MQPKPSDWYRRAWTLDILNQSWAEDTQTQVNFLLRELCLGGTERILDLACGFGRHALALARLGFSVVGVDLTPAYVSHARESARAENLPAAFHCMDVRDIPYEAAFDVVLSLADGAIGYLETDEENLKIFDRVARALRPGGRHVIDVCNAAHAERYFPKKWWEVGKASLSLAEFEWDPATRRMLFGGWDIPYGQPARAPEIREGDPIRLYDEAELRAAYAARGMALERTYGDYHGCPADGKTLQLIAIARKLPGPPDAAAFPGDAGI